MAGVTQNIPQYSQGISEQPDCAKISRSGNRWYVANAIPDVGEGFI